MKRKYTIKAISVCAAILLLSALGQAQYDRGQSTGDFPLPVSLVNFSTTGAEQAVILHWKTASEIDILGFNLYRSLGQGGTYNRINSLVIPSQGTGPVFQDYEYVDAALIEGFHYYYKLATVEINGRENIMEPAILGIAGNNQGSSWTEPPDYTLLNFVSLKGNYPEPFNSQTSIAFSVYENSPVKLEIYSLMGRKIATLIDSYLAPGEYLATFQGGQLPSGVYLCRMQSQGGFDTIRKMVLLR